MDTHDRADAEHLPSPPPKPGAKADMGQLVVWRVGQQIAALRRHDAEVREGAPEGIHRMRIAARRLRSALTTTKPLFTDPPDDLREELRWLGQELSPARDAVVVHGRLAAAVDAEPRRHVVGPVRRRLRTELMRERREGLAAAQQALASARYQRLLDALDALAADLRLTPAAQERARAVMGDLVRRDARKVHRAMRAANAPDAALDRDRLDEAMHEARKRAKRLRYAAELAVPTGGRKAKKLAKRAKAVQEALGRHQDSVVARQHLLRLGAAASRHGEDAFTFGLLHGAELLHANHAERDFRRAAQRLPRPRAAAAWVSTK